MPNKIGTGQLTILFCQLLGSWCSFFIFTLLSRHCARRCLSTRTSTFPLWELISATCQ